MRIIDPIPLSPDTSIPVAEHPSLLECVTSRKSNTIMSITKP
jgi:hypothetical protein